MIFDVVKEIDLYKLEFLEKKNENFNQISAFPILDPAQVLTHHKNCSLAFYVGACATKNVHFIIKSNGCKSRKLDEPISSIKKG